MLRATGAHSSTKRFSSATRSAVGGIRMSKPASASDGCRFITKPFIQNRRVRQVQTQSYNYGLVIMCEIKKKRGENNTSGEGVPALRKTMLTETTPPSGFKPALSISN